MTPREEILSTAAKLTKTSREEMYGPPTVNLRNCAALWTAYLSGKYGDLLVQQPLTAEDVAWLNVLQKMARTFSPATSTDNYIDAAAYAAIAGECRLPAAEGKSSLTTNLMTDLCS